MKKFAVIVMVLVMVFALSATAFGATYSDVSSLSQTVQDSIAKVSALKVFQGDGDGTFRPADTITRAEFAKVACVAAGLGTAGDALINTPSQFTDVKAGEWWTGWINLASAQGFMKGDPNGTFRPKDPIAMQEVATVLLRMLGYNDNLAGPWPVDYISQASKLDLFDNIAFSGTAYASRSQVAVMLDNNLSEELVVWDNDKSSFVDKDNATTLLNDSFGGVTAEDVVFAGGSLNWKVDAWKYTGTKLDKLELVYADANGAPSELADEYAISGGNTLETLAGQVADVIYNDDDEVVYVDVTSTVVFSTAIKNVVGIITNSGVPGEDYIVDTAGTAYINNVKYSVPVGSLWKPNADETTRVVFDSDDKVVEARWTGDYTADTVYDAVAARLVDKYNSTAKRIEYKSGTALNLSSKNYLVFKDGKAAAIADIEENDTTIVFANACGMDYVIYASSPVTGAVTAATGAADASGDRVTVAGSSYRIANTGAASQLVYTADGDTYSSGGRVANIVSDDLFGETAQYALSTGNRLSVLAFASEAQDSAYGVISSVDNFNISNGRITQLTVCNAAGEFVTYSVDNSDGTVASYDEDATLAGAGVREGMLVKIRLTSDGKIDQITKATAGADSSVVDKDNNRIAVVAGTYTKVASGVAAFDITMESGITNSVDDVDAIAYASLFTLNTFSGTDTDGLDAVQYFIKDGSIVAIAAIDYTGAASSKYGVVKNKAYYTGTSQLVQFYGFDVSDYTFKAGVNTALDNKALVEYTTTGTTLNVVTTLFIPATSAATVKTANFFDASTTVYCYAAGALNKAAITALSHRYHRCLHRYRVQLAERH